MITYSTSAGSDRWELFGRAEDEKPTDGIPNASTYYEIDGQHRIFMFDSDTKTWFEQ